MTTELAQKRELARAVGGVRRPARPGKSREGHPKGLETGCRARLQLATNIGGDRARASRAVAAPAGHGKVLQRSMPAARARQKMLGGEVRAP